MARTLGGWVAAALAAVLLGCGASGGPTPSSVAAADTGAGTSPSDGGTTGNGGGTASGSTAAQPPSFTPPVSRDGWTYYGSGQGLPGTVFDVSADEGGNVYVAGYDAVYAKRRGDAGFLRFDATNSTLTQNCYPAPPETDPTFNDAINGTLHPAPPGPPILCPVISVAGAAPGLAAIGFKGLGTDGDPDAGWAQDSGGMDVVTFDGATLARRRHVFIASPPGTICGPYPGHPNEERSATCGDPWEYFWTVGRRKLRQVDRIVVNHDQGSQMYGDMWMGGTHATFAALLADAGARGYPDRTAGQTDPRWADAKDVWEHDHPAWYDAASNLFLTNVTFALALQPGSGIPWGSNGLRTAYVTGGYGAALQGDNWWIGPNDGAHPLWIDLWTDPGTPGAPMDPLGGADDHVESLSFCDDGTLWVASSTHGLARLDPGAGGGLSYVDLPDPATHGNNAYAVACDPTDGSVWVGLGWGGVMRYRNGAFTALDPNAPGMPAVVRQPVRSIQIDRWASPRIVYFAFMPSTDASGKAVPGGVAAYAGP
jgi:hypothetical protein